jgi:hypothetical protein
MEKDINEMVSYILERNPVEAVAAIFTLAKKCPGVLQDSLQNNSFREEVLVKVLLENANRDVCKSMDIHLEAPRPSKKEIVRMLKEGGKSCKTKQRV